jgi:hypothetical protein
MSFSLGLCAASRSLFFGKSVKDDDLVEGLSNGVIDETGRRSEARGRGWVTLDLVDAVVFDRSLGRNTGDNCCSAPRLEVS